MSHSVRRHLRLEIEAYDKTIRSFIPAYEEMLTRAADAIAETKPKKVIDLGAGTGALAQTVLQRCERVDGRADRRRRRDARSGPRAARTLCRTSAVHRARVPRPTTRLRRSGRLPRTAPRSHPSRKTDDLQRNSRRVTPRRRIRQRGCHHARRPVHSPSRIRNLGSPTSSPAASPRSAPIAISRNGPTKTLTFPWKTNSPR